MITVQIYHLQLWKNPFVCDYKPTIPVMTHDLMTPVSSANLYSVLISTAVYCLSPHGRWSCTKTALHWLKTHTQANIHSFDFSMKFILIVTLPNHCWGFVLRLRNDPILPSCLGSRLTATTAACSELLLSHTFTFTREGIHWKLSTHISHTSSAHLQRESQDPARAGAYELFMLVMTAGGSQFGW